MLEGVHLLKLVGLTVTYFSYWRLFRGYCRGIKKALLLDEAKSLTVKISYFTSTLHILVGGVTPP